MSTTEISTDKLKEFRNFFRGIKDDDELDINIFEKAMLGRWIIDIDDCLDDAEDYEKTKEQQRKAERQRNNEEYCKQYGHTWTNLSMIAKYCSPDGSNYYQCKVCGEEKTE